jgi:drug/metabolite transporter (DMT)-like permease
MNRNTLIGLLAALAAALLGSGWQILSRHGVTTTLGPLDLAILRYGVPALVLLPLLWRIGLRPAGLPTSRLVWMVLGGGLPFGLLVMAGAQWAPAAHIGVFMAGSVPLFTAAGSRMTAGTALARGQWLGLALVATGLLVLGVSSTASAGASWRGDALLVLAGALWAAYTLAFRGSGLSPWQGAAVVSAWSSLLLVPLVVVLGAPRLLQAPWTDVALQAAGQGVAAGLLGLVAYLAAVTRLGAARAALSAALVPPLTSLGAAWLLHEPLGPNTLAASALVAMGVVMAAGVRVLPAPPAPRQ